MARKTNYAFERNSRAKAKAEKREAKRLAKLALKAEKEPAQSIPEPDDDARSVDSEADDTAKDETD